MAITDFSAPQAAGGKCTVREGGGGRGGAMMYSIGRIRMTLVCALMIHSLISLV